MYVNFFDDPRLYLKLTVLFEFFESITSIHTP